MSRPQSEAEYLARLVPPSVAATSMGRRAMLAGGLGATIGGSALLASCGSSSSTGTATASGSSSAAAGGTVTFGSNQSDAPPRRYWRPSWMTPRRRQASRST